MPCGVMDQFISVNQHMSDSNSNHCFNVESSSGDRKSSSPPIQNDHVDDDNIDKSNPCDRKVVITPRYMMMISMKIILIREQPQVMGKPANALLIDCRSMEGKLVSSSSKFMHDLLKAI